MRHSRQRIVEQGVQQVVRDLGRVTSEGLQVRQKAEGQREDRQQNQQIAQQARQRSQSSAFKNK